MAQPWDHDLAVVHGQLTDTMKDAVLCTLDKKDPGLGRESLKRPKASWGE